MSPTSAASATIDHAASSADMPWPSRTVINGCCMEGTSGDASAGISPGAWTRPSSPPAISDEASNVPPRTDVRTWRCRSLNSPPPRFDSEPLYRATPHVASNLAREHLNTEVTIYETSPSRAPLAYAFPVVRVAPWHPNSCV